MLKPTRNKRRIAALTGTLALSACLALGLAGCAGNEGDGTGEPAAPATGSAASRIRASPMTRGRHQPYTS